MYSSVAYSKKASMVHFTYLLLGIVKKDSLAPSTQPCAINLQQTMILLHSMLLLKIMKTDGHITSSIMYIPHCANLLSALTLDAII